MFRIHSSITLYYFFFSFCYSFHEGSLAAIVKTRRSGEGSFIIGRTESKVQSVVLLANKSTPKAHYQDIAQQDKNSCDHDTTSAWQDTNLMVIFAHPTSNVEWNFLLGSSPSLHAGNSSRTLLRPSTPPTSSPQRRLSDTLSR